MNGSLGFEKEYEARRRRKILRIIIVLILIFLMIWTISSGFSTDFPYDLGAVGAEILIFFSNPKVSSQILRSEGDPPTPGEGALG